MELRSLNLYAGLGGNRRDWPGRVTAVEQDPKIAEIYQQLNPQDEVIVGDAHDYLLNHFDEYDIIWSSPPCQSHSRMIQGGRNRKPRYPDMKLYEEILFLRLYFEGAWVVENVVPRYDPLIPAYKIGRHLFWSDTHIPSMENPPEFKGFMSGGGVAQAEELKKWLGLHFEGNIYYGENHDPGQVLRNCVHPDMGNHVMSALTGHVEVVKSHKEQQDLFGDFNA